MYAGGVKEDEIKIKISHLLIRFKLYVHAVRLINVVICGHISNNSSLINYVPENVSHHFKFLSFGSFYIQLI